MLKNKEDALRLEEDSEKRILPKEKNFGEREEMVLKKGIYLTSFVK